MNIIKTIYYSLVGLYHLLNPYSNKHEHAKKLLNEESQKK